MACSCDPCGCNGSSGVHHANHQSPKLNLGQDFMDSMRQSVGCGTKAKPKCPVDPCDPHEWIEYMRVNAHPLWAGDSVGAKVVGDRLVATGDDTFVYTSPIIDAGQYDCYQVELEGEGDQPLFEFRAAKTRDGIQNQAFRSAGPLSLNFRYVQYRAIVRAI